MFDAHTLSVASLVSQATLAVTLGLLTWSDRRTKGMGWLACAAALQVAVSAALLSPAPNRMSDATLSAFVVLLHFFFYMGLRWFAVRRSLRSQAGPVTLGLTMLAILFADHVHPKTGLVIGRIAALVMVGMIVRMLWSSRLVALRIAMRCSSVLLAALATFGTVRTFLQLVPASPAYAHWNDWIGMAIATAKPALLLSYLGLFVAEANRRLHDETRLDVLTGLRNRRALEEIAAREAHRCAVEDTPLALLMMDLDHFKQLNDTWGHGLGDRALRTMGSILLTVVGDGAVTARIGGEEFALLLPGFELEEAAVVAERVRAAVEDLKLVEGDRVARFTVSVGISVMQQGERTWTEMMTRADDALYRAKREGRNRVAVGAPENAPALRRERKQSSWKKHLLLPRQGPML